HCCHRLLVSFNYTSTTHIYTLPLHDALPISDAAGRPRRRESATKGREGWNSTRSPRAAGRRRNGNKGRIWSGGRAGGKSRRSNTDRKSTRLNSSHVSISYAVFCLKKETKPAT